MSARGRGCVAAIVHPQTLSPRIDLREELQRRAERAGWSELLWLETTADDPGTRLATRAIEHGAFLVLACGGDGTIRAVATALAGTGVPLGLVPTGTGNLLARNLGVPRHLDTALEVALTGRCRTIDLGRVGHELFAVMAGVGLDTDLVAGARPEQKARLGWGAYVLAAARHLRDRPLLLALSIDDGPWEVLRVRCVLVGNVGRLQADVPLLPAAEPADGVLDVAVLAPRGLVGWLRVALRVLRGSERDDHRLRRCQERSINLLLADARPYELDGDLRAATRGVHVGVEPGALVVRVPR